MTIGLDDIKDDISPSVYKKLKEIRQKKEDEEEINSRLKELDEDHKHEIQQKISLGEIVDFSKNNMKNGHGSNKNSNKNEEDDDDKNDFPINKYSQGISLAESILVNNIPYFIQIIDGKPIFKQKIELPDINIVPPERTEYLSKEYSFNSFDEVQYFIDLARTETLDSLFTRVKNELTKYIDIDKDFINILAADIVFTYFQDKLGMTHYLLIVGDNNTGKSNVYIFD